MYQVLIPGIYTAAVSTAAAVVYSRCPDRTAVRKGCAVRIEPRPSSPSTCRLCASSSRTLFPPQASGDGTRMQSVLGESGASCRLSINSSRVASNSGSQQQQYEELVDNSGRWLTHPPLRTPPMPHQEFLAEGRATVGLHATASVCVRSS